MPEFSHYAYDPNSYYQPSTSEEPFNQTFDSYPEHFDVNGDEPPLLDELEIYPSRIIDKSLAVLNPFHALELNTNPAFLFEQTDLAGPIFFCLTMAASLFITGSKAHFGYIYGLCVISVIGMYVLISLMCNTVEHFVSVGAVASILGYSLLPLVGLSVLRVFITLNSMFGFMLAGVAVILATRGSSNVFCVMTGDPQQRWLFAFPCALLYLVFMLLVLF